MATGIQLPILLVSQRTDLLQLLAKFHLLLPQILNLLAVPLLTLLLLLDIAGHSQSQLLALLGLIRKETLFSPVG